MPQRKVDENSAGYKFGYYTGMTLGILLVAAGVVWAVRGMLGLW